MAPQLTRRDLAAVAQYLQDESLDPDTLDSQQQEQETEEQVSYRPRRQTRVVLPAWLVSLILHTGLMVILAVFYVGLETTSGESLLYVQSASASEELDDEFEDLVPPEELRASDELSLSVGAFLKLDSGVPEEVSEIQIEETSAAAPLSVDFSDLATDASASTELLQAVGATVGADLEGRSDKMRAAMLAKYGGSAGSERAVAMALRWFAKHQRQDGSWSFDFRHSCRGKCSQSGRMETCWTGATAMALLPFLGAGQTHAKGEYKENVAKGIRFLLRAQDRNGSLVSGGGSMYSHGLATIALCEAYAMTRDQFLKVPAQRALDFIVFAQDPLGGGWRYMIRTPGDTSAVAWQVMALKSGHMGNLSVPNRTVLLVDKFLTSVQSDGGAVYGYMDRSKARPSTTAAGLLCRMYLGTGKDHPGMARGIENLSKLGPAADERATRFHMYYNYYATQVLRHYGGEAWEKWNGLLRDFLVKTQQSTGHQAGSWTVPNWEAGAHDTEMGGRLYYTSLATMILEVYYRHMPIYREDAAEEFPL